MIVNEIELLKYFITHFFKTTYSHNNFNIKKKKKKKKKFNNQIDKNEMNQFI